MPQGLSAAEYAARVGLSRQAVDKARATGKLVLHADGSIDPEASDRRRAETTDPAMQRGGPNDRKPVPEGAMAAVAETLREEGIDGAAEPATDSANVAPSAGVTFMNARTANEVMKAQERRLNLQIKRGELVSRKAAHTLYARLFSEIKNAWQNWPTRVAAQMAAELGVETHRMQNVLQTYVAQHLDSIKEGREFDLR